ncbi:SOS response transcriptional repressor, RecA-mediated autopeptidase [Marinitoga piezophila KA3]|uniref:SOS response transcriptional repressor, RecA-mediated autopeptidase n=2 Tax=Petrotogaceae TaxID=1643949 RepID=H2J6P1_MARPK|nr:SOS response transcriptional repressor, RecA-mediated autopeptidase [Marinitoga piezophila KA3]
MIMKGLTEKQKRIYEYINFYINVKGYPPSMREIAEYLNLKSVSTVYSQLKSLEKKGYIELSGKSRGINILKNEKSGFIEVHGEIAENKLKLYSTPFYLKTISSLTIRKINNFYNVFVVEKYKDFSSDFILIVNENLEIIGTIKISEVILDENSYRF